MHHPTDRIAHTTAFVTPVVEHWLEWEIASTTRCQIFTDVVFLTHSHRRNPRHFVPFKGSITSVSCPSWSFLDTVRRLESLSNPHSCVSRRFGATQSGLVDGSRLDQYRPRVLKSDMLGVKACSNRPQYNTLTLTSLVSSNSKWKRKDAFSLSQDSTYHCLWYTSQGGTVWDREDPKIETLRI